VSIRKILFLLVVVTLAVISAVDKAAAQSAVPDEVLNRVVAQEQALTKELAQYTPLVETYLQNLEPNEDLGTIPRSDNYFLGKVNLANGVSRNSFFSERGLTQSLLSGLHSVKYVPEGFAQMIIMDTSRFDRDHYGFEYIRRECLGEVRCIVFDVTPKVANMSGAFLGRIWVEDQDYHVVRFNGTYTNPGSSKVYFHFDSWRQEMGPHHWLPSYVYSEDSNRPHIPTSKGLHFKAQTRIWGYGPRHLGSENEFTSLTVDSGAVVDHGDVVEESSPVLSQRAWDREAEQNVLQRLEKAGLLAPQGAVDKVLETVVNNLAAANELAIEPDVHCRILLTSPLESFTVGHTIIVSRGLIDVLPDEASLAMILAHELGHIASGHRLDSKYGFSDRMVFEDFEAFHNVFIKRDDREEKQADQKGIEFLRNSPYKDHLASAALFLRALSERSKRLPNLLNGTMGNRLAAKGETLRMPELMQAAPTLELNRIDQIAALPLGARVRVDPWNNTIELMKTKPVHLISAGEKLQFEIAPIHLYLTRQNDEAKTAGKNQ